MCSKLAVFLTSFVLVFGLVCANAAFAAEIDIRIADGGDDAEQHLGDGSMDIGSSDLELPYEDAGNPTTDEQVIGLRFVGIPVNKGGPVTGAYVEIEVDKVDKEGSANPVNLIIEGELVPNAAAFADDANNITGRASRTTAKVKWSVPPWTAENEKFQSPDISSIIQEIVDQNDWVSGNALVLIISDDKENSSTGLREAEAYEGEAGAAPLLHLVGTLSIIELASEPNPADGAAGVSSLPNLGTYLSSDVPKNIPDFRAVSTSNVLGEATSTLSVADSIKITDLNVELDITMPGNNADLNVYLKSPDGKEVELFTDVGLHGADDFKNTILDDEASTSIRDGTDKFTGIYKPEGKLSDFDGRNASGNWRLKIQDDWYGGPGTLNSWRLVIESPALLKWTPPGEAASQDVYFADNFEDVNNSAASALLGNLPADAASVGVGPLALGQTYYWRVDTVTPDGRTGRGDIWSFTTAAGNVAVEQKVLASNDDGEDHIAYGSAADDGAESLTSSDLEMPWEGTFGTSSYQVIGLRFADLMVAKGMEIIGAYVQFTADNENLTGGPVNLIINGLLQPDTTAFTSGENFVEREPKTSAQVSWTDIPAWTSTQATLASRTPDISEVVKEIIGQDAWAQGNALMLFIRDDETSPSADNRSALSVDESAAVAALLHIDGITEAASAPSPADGAVDVVQNISLSWAPGFSAVSRDVYFGTSSSPAKQERTTGISFALPKLATSTTYYWRIDEIEADGTKHTGTVWSFTTVIGEATNPNPADKAAGVPVNVVLSWTPGATAVSHDGYIGTTSPPPFLGNTTENSFDTATIGGLQPDTIYYWQLDAIEADGTKHVGDIWAFKTVGPNAGAQAGYYTGRNFEELALTRTDPQIDFNWGTGAPDPALGVDNFSVKWVAELEAAFSDTYTLWTESDDGVRVWLDGELVIDSWIDQSATWNESQPIELVAGERHILEMAYYENGGDAVARLHWSSPTQPRRAVDALLLPRFAQNPDPADGALIEQTWVMLSWTAGVTAASHNVNIGTAPDALELQASQAETMLTVGLPGLPLPDGLVPGTTYYWRIDEVEADPNILHEGLVWSFTIPPLTAYNPSPADGAVGMATDVVLSWTAGLGAKLHSVYFGDDLDTVTNASGAPPLPVTTFNPGPLEQGKTYYWRVDEFNPPTTVTGNVWSFTTVEPPPPPPAL
jgi:subtilisin-like proprotein convertase family protein